MSTPTPRGPAPRLPPNRPRISSSVPPGARAPDIPGSPSEAWQPYLHSQRPATDYAPAPYQTAHGPRPTTEYATDYAPYQSAHAALSRDRSVPAPAPAPFPYTSPAPASAPFPHSSPAHVPSYTTLAPPPPPAHAHSLSVPSTPRVRTLSSFDASQATMAFPKPGSFDGRSQSYLASGSRMPTHRPSRSDAGRQSFTAMSSASGSVDSHGPPMLSPQPSVASFDSQSIDEFADDDSTDTHMPDMSRLDLDTQQGILDSLALFQAGRVPDAQAEWYAFVPKAAVAALDKAEVERQSVIFELVKAEQEYVEDLRLIQELFVHGLRAADPPVIARERLKGFVQQVFGGIDLILGHHQRMLAALYERQREQHPLVQSVADIVLDNTLKFVPEYENYMKNSPIALELHRKELARTPAYAEFLTRCAADRRVRRRDLKTLLSRPVTRLPRMKLVLERILKRTPQGHEDGDVLPIAIGVLDDFIRSTQPGMQVSESKVKFWDICESLVWAKGEIIDPDLYDDSRALVHTAPLARRNKSGHGWSDVVGALLDNYLLLLHVDDRHTRVRRQVVSRPIPLEYLRIVVSSFSDAAETRRDGGGVLPSLSLSSSSKSTVYPFTLFHAGTPNTRRYTLYAPSEGQRDKWREALVDAVGVRSARMEANRWFAEQVLEDGTFRQISTRVKYAEGARFTGKVLSAAAFVSAGRAYLAVSTPTGVYVGPRSSPVTPTPTQLAPAPPTPTAFRRVLTHVAPTLTALQAYRHLLVQTDRGGLLAYSLDLLARVSAGEATGAALDGSCEVLARDGDLLFVRAGEVRGRTIVAFASKGLLHVTLHALEAVRPGEALPPPKGRKSPPSYRPYGAPVYIPRDTYDATFLGRSVAAIGERSVTIVDPTEATPGNPSKATHTVPDWSLAGTHAPISALKGRVEAHRLLGLVRIDKDELLAVYDELGFFLDKHGAPARNAGYVRWEAPAAAYAVRGPHLLLFAARGTFVEVRLAARGRLVQVLEGADVRLASRGPGEREPLLFAARGALEDARGLSERLVELVPTAPFGLAMQQPPPMEAWDQWDMA